MQYKWVKDYYKGSTSRLIVTNEGRVFRKLEPDYPTVDGRPRFRVKLGQDKVNVTDLVLNTPTEGSLTQLPGYPTLFINTNRELFREVECTLNSKGYKRINISYEGKKSRSQTPLHQVVFTLFHHPIEEGHVIHHKDFNKLNNHESNLQQVTRKEHNGIHGNQRKYTEVILEKDGVLYHVTDIRGFAKSKGHNNTSHIYDLIRGSRKSCYGYKLVEVKYVEY